MQTILLRRRLIDNLDSRRKDHIKTLYTGDYTAAMTVTQYRGNVVVEEDIVPYRSHVGYANSFDTSLVKLYYMQHPYYSWFLDANVDLYVDGRGAYSAGETIMSWSFTQEIELWIREGQ